jgi:hypothetical protein
MRLVCIVEESRMKLKRRSVCLLAVIMAARPAQASQAKRASVRILEKRKDQIKATATKTAVQAPCEETALKPIETLRMADPVMNT